MTPYARTTTFAPQRIATVILAAAAAVGCSPAPETTAFIDGEVLTMNEAAPVAEALGMAGGRIEIVGTTAEVTEWAEENGAKVRDLAGRTLMPGFIDAHGHFPGEGLYAVRADLNSPPIGTVENIEDLLDKMRELADDTPDGEWVMGIAYDDSLLAEGRHPLRTELDSVSTKHPVIAWHISLHFASVNSLALEKLGIDRDTPDPDGGHIRRDPSTGEPDGVLEENATLAATDLIGNPGLSDTLSIIKEANRRSLASGVTCVQSGYTQRAILRALPVAAKLGLIDVRMVLWPGDDVQDEILDGEFTPRFVDDSWSRVGAVKLVTDGSIQGYTGYLSKPYHVPMGEDPEHRGYPRMARDEVLERVERYHGEGLQIAAHGNGDAAIDNILDAFERSIGPGTDARPVIIHAQMSRPDQIERMAKLRAIPSFFVLHTYYWGDRHRNIFLGPERAERISPLAEAEKAGVRFTIHADSPVVPMEPLRLVWSAVNRTTRSGRILGPDQRISPMAALRATTIDAAYQHFQEDMIGSLEPGKLADLVILSRSPLASPETIDEIDVLETIIEGRTLYRADH